MELLPMAQLLNKKLDPLDIDAVLPQTQCRECGFQGCLPYANAIAENKAAIDLCITGGEKTLRQLAELTQDNAEDYLADFKTRMLKFHIAQIREPECIGCTKCIQACPVDAIIGSGKYMHQMIASECTGCGLCLPPCPVDCIDLITTEQSPFEGRNNYFRMRYLNREKRLKTESEKINLNHLSESRSQSDKKAFILAARKRAAKE